MKDIKDYLHLYLGCHTKHGKLVGIRSDRAFCEMADGTLVEGSLKAIRPILRPLSDMTEEEKITLFDFVYPNGIGLSRLREDKLAFIEYALDIQMSDSSTNAEKIMSFMTIYQMSSMVQWTLPKGFDLFGLIEAGLAIDKTTLKQN